MELSWRAQKRPFETPGRQVKLSPGDGMKKIWQVGLDRDSEFAIPEPLAYVPSLRLLIQEKVSGKPAKEVFLAGSPAERAEAAERCGHWLMWFQILAPQQGKVMTVRKLLRRC